MDKNLQSKRALRYGTGQPQTVGRLRRRSGRPEISVGWSEQGMVDSWTDQWNSFLSILTEEDKGTVGSSCVDDEWVLEQTDLVLSLWRL